MGRKSQVIQLSEFGFHEGEALLRVAGIYTTLMAVIKEGVQNALDRHATRMKIIIDRQKRDVTAFENGYGTDPQLLGEALVSVCRSVKKKEDLGQFGIGLVSPLGKCEEFVFTSVRRGGDGIYREWTFNTEDLRKQSKIEGIPYRERPEFKFYSKAREGDTNSVWWRTKTQIRNYTTDKMISRVGLIELCDSILDRFRKVMAEKGTEIEIVIRDERGKLTSKKFKAGEFQGQPLDPVTYQEEGVGSATFKLFLSPVEKGRKRGKVLIGVYGDKFRVPFYEFNRRARAYLNEEVQKALKSGIFEGEITAKNIKLNPERTSFLGDDAFVGFCICIETWFEQVGHKHFKEANQERRHERFQELGKRSMKILEGMLQDERFAHLLRAIKTFKKGTIGSGHADVPEYTKLKKKQDKPSIAVGPQSKSLARGSGGEEGEPRERDHEEATERKSHTPLSVQGTRGIRRRVVRSNSLGLQFAYEILPGETHLWKLDTEMGILIFNIRHQLWAQLESNDTKLMRLQELCAIKALTLLSAPPQWREVIRETMDDLSEAEAFWIEMGDKLADRGPGGKRAKSKKKTDSKSKKK